MIKYLKRREKMNRHENRKNAMFCTYQYLIQERDINDLIESNFKVNLHLDDPYIEKVIHTAIENKDRYAGYIDQVLDDWKFSRLGYVEQAILLCGCAEFDLKEVETPVVIDEYVILTKEYCDPESYKLINGVLDRV